MVPVSFTPPAEPAGAFAFAGEELRFAGERALFWAQERALIVADLHLEKASWFASRGSLLPPYDSRATLESLADAIRTTGARRVFCLGDNFHDASGPLRLDEHAGGMLAALTRATDWVWITGNHDEKHAEDADRARRAGLGGQWLGELAAGPLTLRHHALPGERNPELSGHFHPRISVPARGRRVVRPCAVASENRLVLPAFGALTGGMPAHDPAILGALQPARAIDALVSAGSRVVRLPLWRKGAPLPISA